MTWHAAQQSYPLHHSIRLICSFWTKSHELLPNYLLTKFSNNRRMRKGTKGLTNKRNHFCRPNITAGHAEWSQRFIKTMPHWCINRNKVRKYEVENAVSDTSREKNKAVLTSLLFCFNFFYNYLHNKYYTLYM